MDNELKIIDERDSVSRFLVHKIDTGDIKAPDHKLASDWEGKYFISTVKVPDHLLEEDQRPFVYETMVFKENAEGWIDFSESIYMHRASTEEQSLKIHELTVGMAKQNWFEEVLRTMLELSETEEGTTDER